MRTLKNLPGSLRDENLKEPARFTEIRTLKYLPGSLRDENLKEPARFTEIRTLKNLPGSLRDEFLAKEMAKEREEESLLQPLYQLVQ